jgi:hypothetical protein
MKELLQKLHACKDAIEWAGDKTWEEIYNTCHRGDWLLWLFKRTNPDDLQLLILAKGHCANTVRHLMKDERSIKAVDAAIAYGEGKISREELDAAAYAAVSAAAAYGAAYGASDASYSAAYSAAVSTAAYIAAVSAADASFASAYGAAVSADAYIAAVSAADASYTAAYSAAVSAAAKKENEQLTADMCRKHLPIEVWNVK